MIALFVALAAAAPVRHELTAGGGAGFHAGAKQTAVGFGPSVGYRLHALPWLAAQVDLGPRVYAGRLVEVDLGVVVSRPARWSPGLDDPATTQAFGVDLLEVGWTLPARRAP